jgi:hypothetical protein
MPCWIFYFQTVTKDMVELTMALFARFRVNGDVAEIFTLDMIT